MLSKRCQSSLKKYANKLMMFKKLIKVEKLMTMNKASLVGKLMKRKNRTSAMLKKISKTEIKIMMNQVLAQVHP